MCNYNRLIEAGIDSRNNVWSQLPIYLGKDIVSVIDDGICKVKMEGITHIIIDTEKTKELLGIKKPTKSAYKDIALGIFNHYAITSCNAIGAMFLESIDGKFKLHPVVWVKTIDTFFYETACGSGTTAIAILETINKNLAQTLEILQPSGKIITARTWFDKGRLLDASISGKIKTDGKRKRLEINID